MSLWRHCYAAIAGCLALAACNDTAPTSAETGADAFASRSHVLSADRYPTEDEWIAHGGSLYGGFEIEDISGSFSTGSYSASGRARFLHVNDLSLTTTATVYDAAGSVVGNPESRSLTWGGLIPLQFWTSLQKTASKPTGVVMCGLSGTPTIDVSASLTLIRNQWGITRVWEHDDQEDGIGAYLPLCPSDPGGPGGGGGGEEPGGCQGQVICQQWFWYENGVIVDEWWECWCESTF